MKQLATLLLMCLVAVIFGWGFGRAVGENNAPDTSPVTSPVTSGELSRGLVPKNVEVRPLVDDQFVDDMQRISSLRGEGTTVFLVFSTDCGSCTGEAIEWKRIHTAHTPQTEFIGLAVNSDVADILDLRRWSGITFPLAALSLRAAADLGVPMYPTVFAVDNSGAISFMAAGPDATVQLDRWLAGAS